MIADAPEYPAPYALLAQILSADKETYDDAIVMARQAIAVDPEYPYAYYALAVSLYQATWYRKDNYEAVDQAMLRAIELDPYDPDYRSFRGAVFMDRNRWDDAKTCLLEALSINPDHHQSLTLLARIESRQGNTEEAKRIAEQAVKNSPEDADAHVSRGYSFIYSNRPKEAFEAFREALRLEPNSNSARQGLLLALQMHHFFYRAMFNFFAVMNRLSSSMQWGLIIGLYIGYRILLHVSKEFPTSMPYIIPLLLLYVLFVFMSWLSTPISNFLLLFDRWGRLTMNGRQKAAGIVVAAFLPLGILGFLVPFGSHFIVVTAIGMLLTLLPLTHTLLTDDPKLRKKYGCYTLAMAGFLLAGAITHNDTFTGVAVLMLFVFQFWANSHAIRSTAPQ